MGQSAALTQAAGSRGALWGRGTFPVSVWGAMAGPMDPLHDPAVLFRLLRPRFFGLMSQIRTPLVPFVNQNTPVLAPCTSRLRDENLVLNSLAKEK